MRILLINTSDRTGGAAVAANRLLKALQKKGIIANMLVRDKVTQDTSVVSINTSVIKKLINRIRFVWERLVIFLCNHLSKENLFQVSIANTGTDILHSALVKEADVIHIHWINQGMLSLSDIKRLIDSGKPVVWTLHDMWPATGVCHYAGLCDQYRSSSYGDVFMLAMSTGPTNGMPSCSHKTSCGTSKPIKRQIDGVMSVMASCPS